MRRSAALLGVLLLAAGSAGGCRTVRSPAVPGLGRAQRHSLSCEACAAVGLLEAHGIRVDEDVFLGGLARADNPERGFVGDVDGPPGRLPPEAYGVHAGPLAARLRDFGLDARAERGRDREWLEAQLPVAGAIVVWVTGDLVARRPVVLRDRRGEAFVAVPWEHAVLAVGADAAGVSMVDPGCGTLRRLSWDAFLPVWACLGGMAVWAPVASRNVDIERSAATSRGPPRRD